MDEFWGITILLFIVLTVFIAFILRLLSYYTKHKLVLHKRVRLTRCQPYLKSGDIIFFIAHAHGFVNSIFSGDLYSHGAVVVKIDGELYLSESTSDSPPDPTPGGAALPRGSQVNPMIFPMIKRLHTYGGATFLMRLDEPLTPEQEIILQNRVRVELPYPDAINAIKSVMQIPSHTEARHCMQHISWLIDEIKLTPSHLAETGDTLCGTGFLRSSLAVSSLPGKPLGIGGGNRYLPIKELVLDDGANYD